MSKRARWNGAEEVRVTWPPGAVYPDGQDIVVPGGLLTEDAPAAVRDELLTRPDWSAVNQSTDTSSKDDTAKTGGKEGDS